jgi:hypothetical protein
MADNVEADVGSGGAVFAAASLTFSGDTAVVPGGFTGILSGSEGAWTYTLCVGGAGAVTAGTPRMTLAIDDPAVAKLGTIDTDTGNIATSAASIDGKLPSLGQALAAASVPVVLTAAQITTLTPPAAITGFALEATLGTLSAKFASGTVIGDVNLGATDNAVLDAIAASLAGTLTVGTHAVTQSGTWNVGTVTTVTTVSTVTNLAQMGGAAIAMGTGVRSAGTQRVTIATDDIVPVSQSGTWNVTNISGTISLPSGAATEATLSTLNGKITACDTGAVTISAALPAGTNAIGKLAANSGVDIGDVDVTSIIPGTGATNLGKAEDAAHASGDVGVMPLSVRQDTAAALGQTDGDYQPLITDNSGRLWCVLASTQVLSSIGGITTLIGGSIAHDSADSGINPHKIGAKATTSISAKTMVANDDITNLFAGIDGVQVVRQHCNLEDIVTATPVAITDGSSTSVLAAQGAGIKTYITEVTIANSSASFVTVDLRDGTAGSVKWTFPVPATGGVTKTFNPPLPFSANTAVAADPSAAASTITVSVLGFKSKV